MTPSSAKQLASAVLSRRPVRVKHAGQGVVAVTTKSKDGRQKSQVAGERVDQTVGLNAGAIEMLTGWLGH